MARDPANDDARPARDDNLSESVAPGRSAEIRLSRKREWLFRLVLLALPFALLLGAELFLRWLGRGGYPPVIRHIGKDGHREWYSIFRPGVDSFFYEKRSQTGGMRTFAFNTPKPPKTIRIVLIGESAMQGYPQELPLTNGSFLQQMLQDLWGEDRRVEVLNLGATAVASFPAMHFLDEMLEHEPDLVVIMCGNNEFYGAYGVCSLHTSGTSALGMRITRWVRGLALTQWLSDLLFPQPPLSKIATKPLMERVAVRSQVGPEDRLRQAASRTLQTHLSQMVRRCAARNVPVIVCTTPTNERGLAPVGQDVTPPLPAGQLSLFATNLARAKAALPSDPASAVNLLQAAVSIYPKHALSHFLLGQAYSALGRHQEALAQYIAARDLDTMPWRATSAANDAARRAASRGALLCDMEAAFRAESPRGAIGWELMDDHVHMTLRGQALFALNLIRALTNLPPPLRVEASRINELPAWETYADRLGRSVYTDYAAAHRMKTLFDIPFMERSNPEARARVAQQQADLLARVSELDRKAASHWHDPGLHVFNHRPLTGVVGYYRMMDGDFAAAAPLFRVARECVSNVSLWRLQYTWYLLSCNRRVHPALTDDDRLLCQEAIEVGELLERFVGFPEPLGPGFLGMAHHRLGEYAKAVEYLDDVVGYAKSSESVEVVEALADSLVRLGQVDRARYLLTLAQKDPAMEEMAQRMLSAIERGAARSPETPP